MEHNEKQMELLKKSCRGTMNKHEMQTIVHILDLSHARRRTPDTS